MKNDFRARNHPAYWAFIVHRVSGLLLTFFLPLHFWALGQAFHGAAGLDRFLEWTQNPLVKFAEPSHRWTASPRARISRLAQLAEKPAGRGGRRHRARRSRVPAERAVGDGSFQ